MADQDSKSYHVEIPPEAVEEALRSVEKPQGNDGEMARPGAQVTTPNQIVDVGTETAPPREELEEALAKAREEAEAIRDRMLRIAADADNLRKRTLKERDESLKFGMEGLFRELLPIVDNLELTLAHLPEDPKDPQFHSLRVGVEMVLRQFTDTLSKYDVVGFSAVGKRFDPNEHEAVSRTETTSAEPGVVLSEMQRGYLLHDRLLRPALVIVACRPSESSAADDNGDAVGTGNGAGQAAQSQAEELPRATKPPGNGTVTG